MDTSQRVLIKGYFAKGTFKEYFYKGTLRLLLVKLLFPMVLSQRFSFPMIFFKYTFPKPLHKSAFPKALSKRYLSRVSFPQRVLCPNTFPRELFQWDAFLRAFSQDYFSKNILSINLSFALSLELPVFSFFKYLLLCFKTFFLMRKALQ